MVIEFPLSKEIKAKINKQKLLNKKIGFTNGCFDLLHPGHKHLINESKKECDYLVIGLNSDHSVRRIKGNSRPVESEYVRKKKLQNLEAVDEVIIFNELTPENLIQEIIPNILIKGDDYEESEIIGSKFVKLGGGKVLRVKLLEGFSTTKIIEGSFS